MRPRASGSSLDAIAGRPVALAALCALSACTSTPEALPALPERMAPMPGALRVELVFSADADLDLYVTDPLRETVYFANSPTRRGGVLLEDLRCDAAAPRVETVVFDDPPPGKYRVGVDFPRRCRFVDRVPFAVRVDADGLRLEERGEIRFPSFQPIVIEFELPED